MLELHTRFGNLQILDAIRAREILSEKANESNQTFHFVNAFVLAEANKHREYFQILTEGTCFCDSRPLMLYSKIAKSRIKQLRGFDFLQERLQNLESGPQLIIGGTKKNEAEINELVDKHFEKRIEISFHQPEFSSDISVLKNGSLLSIERCSPATIWIGVGTPKQDYLASRLRDEVDANLFCVGAAIAFLVGDVVESPKWIQRVGLEWLYRLIKEPRRLWKRYFFGNFQFLQILFRDLIYRIFSR